MNSACEFVWPHLSRLPTFRALIRSIEHRLLSEYQPLDSPVLDIGTGDGHFASVALTGPIQAGIDVALAAMQEARERRIYSILACSTATAMPFRSEHFATVVSNCVVEHIPDLDGALSEAHRVLNSRGTLLLTVPTDYLEKNLLIPRMLASVRLGNLSNRYLAWFRRRQVHYHLLSREQWVAAVEERGFSVTRTRGYLSARATKFFELGHYAGWHNILARRTTGRWVLFPWRPLFYPTEQLLASFVEEREHPNDSCLLIEAHKSSS